MKRVDCLPCPFCCSNDIHDGAGYSEGGSWFYQYCIDCNAQGPETGEDRKLSIKLWNTRKGGI